MNDNTSKSNIEQRLEELKDVPARNPLQAARDDQGDAPIGLRPPVITSPQVDDLAPS